jgi:hypothetical protein
MSKSATTPDKAARGTTTEMGKSATTPIQAGMTALSDGRKEKIVDYKYLSNSP